MAVKIRYTIEDYNELNRNGSGRKFKPNAWGAPVAMSPNMDHSHVQGEVIVLLKLWLRDGALPGYMVGPELTHRLGDRLIQPDVSVARAEDGPYPQRGPRLAVEVLSAGNSWPEMRVKAERYLAFGTQMVWLVDPRRRVVELHRPATPPQTLSGAGLIDGGAALPGFRVTVQELFPA